MESVDSTFLAGFGKWGSHYPILFFDSAVGRHFPCRPMESGSVTLHVSDPILSASAKKSASGIS